MTDTRLPPIVVIICQHYNLHTKMVERSSNVAGNESLTLGVNVFLSRNHSSNRPVV